MKLTQFRPTKIDSEGRLREVMAFLIRHTRELGGVIDQLRREIRACQVSMEKIIDGVLASERVLDTIYNYCEKRRREENQQ